MNDKSEMRECSRICVDKNMPCPVTLQIQKQVGLKKDALKKEKEAKRGKGELALELQREIEDLGESECRHWIDYEEDLNCCLIAITKRDSAPMSLREVGDRLNLTFVRVKQIQDKAIQKLTQEATRATTNISLFEDYIREGGIFLNEAFKNKELFED